MMAKQPEQRYPTPARAAQALEVFLLMGNAPPAEEPPQLRKFLTWLEMEDKTAPLAATLTAPPVKPASPAVAARPKSSPAVPVLGAPAPAPRREPLTPRPTPVKQAQPLQAAIPTPAAADIDVELVPMPSRPASPPKGKPPSAGKPKVMLIVAVAAGLVLACGCGGVATLLVSWFVG